MDEIILLQLKHSPWQLHGNWMHPSVGRLSHPGRLTFDLHHLHPSLTIPFYLGAR